LWTWPTRRSKTREPLAVVSDAMLDVVVTSVSS
jgi:hypothetical protein